jgi:O-acetyl-ADP-ribose deacetylase (regulator of RNase III)
MKFIFCDLNKDVLDAYERVLGDKIPCVFCNASIIDCAPECDTLVSASNSRLCFDGGSDLDYITLFNDPHDVMYAKLKSFWDSHNKVFGECSAVHLPVGAAMMHNYGTHKFITAPTMILPQPVPETQNAYFAFKAVLELVERDSTIQNVLVPGLCTGIGRMNFAKSAEQILKAWKDHEAGVRNDVLSCNDFVYDSRAMLQQPDVYMNTMYTQGHTFVPNTNFLPLVSADIGTKLWF